jgi:hypothetical protein
MNSYPRRNRNRGGRMKIPSKEPKEKIEWKEKEDAVCEEAK